MIIRILIPLLFVNLDPSPTGEHVTVIAFLCKNHLAGDFDQRGNISSRQSSASGSALCPVNTTNGKEKQTRQVSSVT